MDVLETPPQCSPEVFGAMVDLVRAAFACSGRPARVDADDIEHLVEVLHVIRPASAELSFFDGWLHMVRQEWSEAESLFRGLVDRSICLPASRGMLLQCLKASQAFGWQDEARKLVEEGGDDEVTRLAKVLLASDDFKQAVATARRTGRFVAPEAALELTSGARADDGARGATAPQAASDVLLTMCYIRV